MVKNIKRRSLVVFCWVVFLLAARYLLLAHADSNKPSYKLIPVFPVHLSVPTEFDDSVIASLVLAVTEGQTNIIVPVSTGSLIALNGQNGTVEWRLDIPKAKNQQVELAATPIVVKNKMAVIYQIVEQGVRISHRMAVVDLIGHCWDESFPVLELKAQRKTADGKAVVKFNPPTAYSHAALKHAMKPESEWGVVYAGFGNAGDTQPFHGWLFEIDLDAWQHRKSNQIMSGILLTTPEPECPVNVEYGTQEMICGGGIWSPSGPQIIPAEDGYDILVPSGNGQVDLARRDYANSLMRVKPGLNFDPECDTQLCRNFNPSQPEEACLSSCKNLFMPRLPETSAPFKPASGDCDNKTFAECLAWMDYDLGGSSPVQVTLAGGKKVLVQPGKDGAVYLIDAGHLGTQYDRLQITGLCGTPADPCKASWMGMIVTQPVLATAGPVPTVIIPTFVPDHSHPAGIVALRIADRNGQPEFEQAWRYPAHGSAKAVASFRSHPSLPVISKTGKQNHEIVWVADVGRPGILYGLRANDGVVLVKHKLAGTGRQLSRPVIYKDTLYLVSTSLTTGKTFVEAYRITVQDR